MKTDVLIIGSGCSGLYCALNLPAEKKITIITKKDVESSDSYLAQGGMCMLKTEEDYDSYFEDTMKAGHYENDKGSVEIMIRSSREVVKDLIALGADFQKDEQGNLEFTREGGHSDKRILFHADVTGREITSKLQAEAEKRENITILEYTTLLDIIEEDNVCYGAVIRHGDSLDGAGEIEKVEADYVVLATGGIGGLYRHSTNFRHLTGDAIAIALNHGITLKDIDYVQIHPTTFYSEKEEDRSFLISESVRGEGAKLYDKNMERFVNELLPRDLLTHEIREQMKKDGTLHVWEDLRTIPREELTSHFPNIIAHCEEAGYDVFKECIPVVPAQHYFMGGIKVDYDSRTSMEQLYAVGETACNGVHGKNRLASNSLLESMVFAKRAAQKMTADFGLVKKNPELIEKKDISPLDENEIRAFLSAIKGHPNEMLFKVALFTGMREAEFEFGILPYPKFTEDQDGYHSRVEGGCKIAVIPVTNKNPENAGALLEAMACYGFNEIIPNYYEIALKRKNSRDEQSAEMLDLIFSTRSYDLGDTWWCNELRDGIFKPMFRDNNRDLASEIKKKSKLIDKTITKAISGLAG